MELWIAVGIALAVGLAIALAFAWRRASREDGDATEAKGWGIAGIGWDRDFVVHELVPGGSLPDSSRFTFQMTAFAPERISGGEAVLLQVYCHLASQREAVRAHVLQRDPDAKSRGETPLPASPAPHDRIRVTLVADGLHIDEAERTLEWTQEPVLAEFELKVPERARESGYVLTLRAEINGVPLGLMKLRLAVRSGDATQTVAAVSARDARLKNQRCDETFWPYKYVFLSYASKDRARVLDVAQGLDRLGIGFFQDVLALRAGDNWRDRIESELNIADAMLLFWSKAAAQSEWVTREAEMALAVQQYNNGAPAILPFILEQPPPLPPPSLAQIHFNDPISCVRAAAPMRIAFWQRAVAFWRRLAG